MMSALLGHLYRDRKRLTTVTCLAFIAGVLLYLRAPIWIGPLHISLVTGLIYAGIVGLAACIVCLLFPNMRFMVEAVALSRLLLALFVLSAPEIGFRLLANPLFTAFIIVTGGVLISRLLHGPILRDPASRSLFDIGRERPPVRAAGKPWQRRIIRWFDDRDPLTA